MLPISDFKSKKKSDFNLVGKIRLKFLVASTLIIAVLLFAQLVFANNLATDGQKLSQIEKQIQKLAAENTTMKMQIAQASSLNSLSKKATELGFSKPSKIIIP